jgi:signal recognition particle receptor subunit beta
MTAFLIRLWNRFSSRRAPVSIMIIGLDDSGKTSILNVLAAAPSITKTSVANSQHHSTSATVQQPRNEKICDEQDSENDDNDQPQQNKTPFTDDGDWARLSNRARGIILAPTLTSNEHGGNMKVSPTIGYNYERIQYKGHTVNLLDFSGQSKYRGLWQEFFNCVDGIMFVIDSSDPIRFVVVRDELENLLGHPYFATIAPGVSSCFALGRDHIPSTDTGNAAARQTQVETAPISSTSQQFVQKQVTISQGRLIQSPLVEWSNSTDSSQTTSVEAKNAARLSSGLSSGAAGGGGQNSSGAQHGKKLRCKIPILFLANKSDLNNSVSCETIAEALKLDQVPQQRHPWTIQATSVCTNQGVHDGFDWLLNQILLNH